MVLGHKEKQTNQIFICNIRPKFSVFCPSVAHNSGTNCTRNVIFASLERVKMGAFKTSSIY